MLKRQVKGNKIISPEKILIVSKNLNRLNLVRSLLGREGYGVITATSIDDAILLCEKIMPSLCLIDNDFSHLENLRLVEILKVFNKKSNGKSAIT